MSREIMTKNMPEQVSKMVLSIYNSKNITAKNLMKLSLPDKLPFRLPPNFPLTIVKIFLPKNLTKLSLPYKQSQPPPRPLPKLSLTLVEILLPKIS
jgi:hypothetical protein